ncbi:MAG: Lrp/AsnC family transcriptional regulator [Paracoccaceae bacterium]
MALAIDDRDLKILAVLSREGRLSKSELAERVNLSASPCAERLRRLEAAGLIRGYGAQVDIAKIGPSIRVFVMVELDAHKAVSFQTFERAVAAVPEITGCWALGGGFDYLLRVVARDLIAYQTLIDGLLQAPTGMLRYFTYVVTKEIRDMPPPVDLLFGDNCG